MNRRSTGLIAGLGCLVVLILIALPIGFLWFAFRDGGIQVPEIGDIFGTPQAQQVPERQTITPFAPDETPGGEAGTPQAEETSPQIPQTANEPGNVAEPVIEPPASLADLYDQVGPGTVSILVSAQMGAGAGSGFVVTDNGYIITNDHVVEGGSNYIVRFYNDVDAPAELVGTDPDSDLALLKVDELPDGVIPLPMGDSESVRVGESVVAIGNPFGLGSSMSYGIVSAIGRTIPSITPQFNIPEAIQTDAAINPGNSGGPLINMRGEVIGVNAQIQTGSQGGGNVGIGFAIPINIVKLVYPSLIETGTYTWPYMGVASSSEFPGQLTPGDQEEAAQGAFIGQVVPGGPADEGGLREGDVVVEADGQPINNFSDLLSVVAFHRPGDQVTLTVLRGGETQQLTVTLGERPRGQFQQ